MAILRLLPGEIEIPGHAGESILEAICHDGFTYRFGCRRGGCGVCKADLVSGEVEYHKAVACTVLTEEERAAGVVLTCRAHPVSDEVVLQMRNADQLKLNVPLAFAMGQIEVAAQKLKAADAQRTLQISDKEEP